jgi:antitoxin MazE
MKARIVRIGNSQGVRIPKPLIEEAGLDGDVEIRVHNKTLVISPLRRPRQGWSEEFKAMAASGDDSLVHGAQTRASRWDEDEWEW